MSEDLKAKNAAEVVKERIDDEMEMSDEENDEDGKTQPPAAKR